MYIYIYIYTHTHTPFIHLPALHMGFYHSEWSKLNFDICKSTYSVFT